MLITLSFKGLKRASNSGREAEDLKSLTTLHLALTLNMKG